MSAVQELQFKLARWQADQQEWAQIANDPTETQERREAYQQDAHEAQEHIDEISTILAAVSKVTLSSAK